MHEAFDLNIRQLVAIDAFEGLAAIGGCGGHPIRSPISGPKASGT